MRATIFALLLVSCGVSPASDRFLETRCCVEVQRYANGEIKRSYAVKREFRKRWPCPTGAELNEPCPGWQIDHTIPLACGGIDTVSNMQWLPVEIKACSEDRCKDRFEREIYCGKKNG